MQVFFGDTTMNLTISGHKGLSLTDALKSYVEQSFKAIYSEFDSITSVRVILKKIAGAKNPEKKFTAAVVVGAGKKRIIVKKITGADMYAAIKRVAGMVKNDFLARKTKLKSLKSAKFGLTEVAEKLNRRVANSNSVRSFKDRRLSFA